MSSVAPGRANQGTAQALPQRRVGGERREPATERTRHESPGHARAVSAPGVRQARHGNTAVAQHSRGARADQGQQRGTSRRLTASTQQPASTAGHSAPDRQRGGQGRSSSRHHTLGAQASQRRTRATSITHHDFCFGSLLLQHVETAQYKPTRTAAAMLARRP